MNGEVNGLNENALATPTIGSQTIATLNAPQTTAPWEKPAEAEDPFAAQAKKAEEARTAALLKAANDQQDREVLRFLLSPEAEDDDLAFKTLDAYSQNRWGVSATHGDMWTSDRQPFKDAKLYRDKMVGFLMRGYEGFASPEYNEWQRAKEKGDRAAMMKLAGVDAHNFDYSMGGYLAGGVAGGGTSKTDAEIDEELKDYDAKMSGQNFVGMFRVYDDAKHFTDEERDFIMSAVKGGEGLPADKAASFEKYCYENPDRAAFVCSLIDASRKKGARWWRDNVANPLVNGVVMFHDGLEAMESDTDEYARVLRDEMRRERQKDGKFYWNDAERGEYERLKADAERKWGEGTQNRTVALSMAEESVDAKCAMRRAEEALPRELRNERRRARILAREATRYRPTWEYDGFSKAVEGVFSTLPYMAVTAVPYLGFALNVAQQMGNTRDELIREGADPDESVGLQFVSALVWAATEKLQYEGLFNKSFTNIRRKQFFTDVMRTAWKDGKIKKIGNAVLHGSKEAALTTLFESLQEGAQGLVEGATNAYLLDTAKGVPLEKRIVDTISKGTEQGYEDFVGSLGTMGILGSIGAAHKFSRENRNAVDTNDLLEYAATQNRAMNVFKNATMQPDGEDADAGAMSEGVARMKGECLDIVRKHKEDGSGFLAAMDEIREKYELDENEARTVADYLDLRENLIDSARNADSDAQMEMIARMGGLYRVGDDTTLDPVDIFRVINPNIAVEEAELTLPYEMAEQGDRAAEPRPSDASGKVAAVQSEIDALEEQRKNAPNAKEKHRLHKAISKARERLREARREGAKEDRRQVSRKVLRVTIPVGDGGERRVVNIEYIRKAPNINTHAYATSVAEAMRGMVGADRGDGTTVADGRGMGVEEFKALPTDEKMAVAVTPEQYLAMTPEERQRYVEREYGIYESGHYQVYDENGKKVFSAEGAIRLSRAVMGGKWTGGNRTIVHEYGHAVVRLMRDLGLVTDEQTQTMRTLFGDPDAAVDELWNEEAMTEAFVEYLRGKYDFRRLTPAERKAAQGWFANLWDTIKACVGIGTGEIPDAPVERTAREQAMDAAFEGLRNGDLKGLPALAGIEKDEKKPDAGENPSQKPADGEAKVEKENDTPDAPKPAEGKEITETAKPSEGQKNQPGTKPTLTKPTAPTPTAKTKAGKDVPDRDAEEAYKRGFADAMAQIASNPGGVAANVPQRTGTHFTVNTPDYEMSVEAEAMWVPLASLVESTDDQEVQMRDRSREATDVQIHNKTRKGKFKAIALFPGTRSDDGAPIVGGGCRIISGHGRKRMLETLLKEGRYGEYLDGINAECARRGMAPAPEGMENPVLVLRVTSGLETRDDLVKFADKSNKTGILEMSAAENAKNDIKAITPQLMSLYSPDASGNLLAASNRPFMAAFLKAIGSTGLTNADGTPTAEAALRAQRALMTAVFGKDDRVRALVQNLLERSSELSLGSLLNSLMKEAGRLISMKNKRGSFDIVNDVSVAAGLYVSYRAEASTQKYPVTFAEWLGTQSLFGDNATQMQKALALLLESGRFGSTLSKYSDLVAEQETDDQGLLGGIVEKRTPLQLLGYAERATLPLAEGLTEAKTDADYAEAPVTPHPDSEVAKSAVVAEPIVQEEDAKPEPAPAEPTKEETKPEKPAPAPDPVAVAEDMVLADARREPFVPKPVAKQTLAPAKLEERVTLTRPNGATKELPGGAWNHLRQGFEWGKVVPKSPQNARGRGLWATSYPWGAADRQSRDSLLKKWGGRCPKYMGNKNAMTTRTVMAVYDQMSPEERAHYEVVNDCFGGGGCWGLTLAMTCFPNARTLNVNEFEEGRLQKIRVLQTFDGRMKESLEAFLARTDLVEKARKVVLVSADGKEKKATWNGQDCRDRTFAAAKEFVGELTEDERGLLFALLDNMQSRMQFGAGDLVDGRYSFDEMVKTAVENLSAEAVKATEMADAFKSRGGSINYVAGDAKQTADFGRGFAVPHGDNVVSVCDPPYYRTTGYTDGGKSTVGLEKNPSGWGYEDTRDMLNALVDLGDALVYTDEAWWLNSNYEARTDEGDLVAGELFGGAFGPTSTYARENAVLQDIINSLDHFDVAGGVASRQEVLGIHHGHSNDHQSADGAVLRAPDDAAGGGLPADGGRVHGRDDEAVGAVDGGDAAQDGAAHGQDAQGDGRGRGGQESATAPARVDAGTAALAREVLTRALAEDIRRERPELTPAVAEAAARHSVRALYARERATPDAVDRDGDGAQRGERHSLIIGRMGAARLGGDVDRDLAIAKRMLNAKETEEDGEKWNSLTRDEKLKIALATGWEVGADGDWRHEWRGVDRKAIRDGLYQSVLDLYKEYEDSPAEYIPTKLGKFLTKDALAAYPRLAEADVRFMRTDGKGYDGRANGETISIYPSALDSGADGFIEVLEHETQHLVQYIEGFARGSNAEYEESLYRKIDTGIPTSDEQYEAEHEAAVAMSELRGAVATFLTPYVERVLKEWHGVTTGGRYDYKGTDYADGGFNIGERDINDRDDVTWGIRDRIIEEIEDGEWGSIIAPDEYFDRNSVRTILERLGLYEVADIVELGDETSASGDEFVNEFNDGVGDALTKAVRSAKWRDQVNYDYRVLPALAGRENYNRVAGEVEARNASERDYDLSQGTGLMLADTEDVPRDQQIIRHSVHVGWRPDFPRAVCMTTRASLMAKHGDDFRKAKAGDREAAARLVEAVSKPDKIKALVAAHPNASIVCPVHAEEATGRNKIPVMFAQYIASVAGVECDDRIVQTVRANHTGSNAAHRLFVSPEFDGEVKKGAEYILVDDHITQGGTVNALRDHIESHGGKVVAVASLTLSQGSSILAPNKETIDAVRRKHEGIDQTLRDIGVADSLECLTQSECRYLASLSPDGLRDRIAASRPEGDGGLGEEAVREAVAPANERRLSPVNEAIRHSLFIGRPQTDYDGGARQATWEEAVFLFHDKFKGRNTDEARAYIYAKTGWWRGADRMWRVEIPNPTAKTRRAKKKIHPSMPANWGVVNGLYVNRDAAEYFCKLTDMVNLPEELVKAYPIIESIGILIMDGDSDDMVGKAGYWNGTGTIALSWDNVKWFNDEPSSVPNDEGVKTITHELQHAIQDNAAFGSGASWTSHGKKNYVRSSGEVEARNAERRRTDVVNEDGDALIYSDLANGQGGEAVRKDAVRIGEAPWQTEDVPTEAQVLTRWDAKRGAFTVDQKGKVVPRQAVKVTRNYSLSTLAVGYLAQREMSGKPVSVEDADKVLKNLGVTKDIDAPTALAKAKKLATENKDALKAMAEKQRPELVEALAKAGMKQEMTETMDALIAGTAKKVDPEVGRRLQKAVTDRETRALMAAKGFTAAQLIAQCPIDLAKGLLAVAEYERTPEEKARLEEARKKREEERAKAMAEDDRTDEEMLADVDDPTVHDPTPDELALFNELMDAARFAEEARKGEEERKRRAIERRKAEEAKRKAEENGEDAGDDGAGDGDGDEPMEGLPADYVRRIAPIFEDADLFAQFVVQWVGRETMKKHPELPTTAEMWKSPVAIRELKQTATNILRRLAKDALGSPALNHARNFADHAINELESDAECKTFNNVRRQIAYIYDAIHNDALRMTRRQLVDRLVNGWKEKGETHPGIVQLAGAKGRFSATTEEFQRKIDGRTEMWARTVKRLVYMSEAKLEAYMEERERIVNANPTAEDLRDAPSADKVRQAADELVLARKYGGLVRQMPGAIADATDEIMTLLNGRLQEFEQRRLEREERNDKVKNAIIAAVMAGKAPAAHGDKSRAVKFVESFQGNVALEMQNLIRYCKDEGLRQAALEAIEELQIAITEGGTDYRNELCKCREEVNDGLTASYGDAVKGINHLKEPLPPEVAGAIFGQDRAMTPTYGHLLQLYASTIQQDYAENAKTYGRDKQLELMEQTLTDGDKAFHAWAVDWYKANRATLSTAVEAVTGVPVTSPDPLYCPVKVERQRDGFAAEVVAWSPIPRALSKRIPHGLDFKESANFLDVLLEEVEVRSQTIGYSALGIMLRDTLASREVQDAVRRNVGAADMAAVTDHLRDIVAGEAGKDKDRTLDLLNTARKWMARFAISGNLSSAMAQPASIPVWANVMLGGESLGFKRVFKYMVNVDKDAIRELIQSGGARARYDLGWSEEVQNVILNPSRNRILRAVEKVYDKGMLVSQLADRCSSLWIAQGFYRDAKARFLARGETEAEAKRKALALTWANVEATQQTGRTEYMNRAQRGSSKIAKALFQFRTAQLLSNNYLIQALREAKAGTPGAKGRLARALAVNAVVVPAYLTLAHALWAFLMGDEPPEDDESRWPTLAKEMLWSMCENTVAPLFVVNTLAEAGVKPLLGQQTYGTSSGIPAIDSTARLIQHGSKAVTDATKWATQNIGVFEWEKEVTTDKVMEDLTRLARDLLAPVRHGTKLYKNRIKEED